MIIEIRNVGFVNKGAELMLHAIIQECRCRIDNLELVIAPKNDNSFLKRGKLGLYQKLWVKKFGVQLGYIFNFFPSGLIKNFGFIKDSDVDVVLDASGFAYGDQWGAARTKELFRYIKKWKKNGTKVILMPQAFGPFSGEIRSYAKGILEMSDLVFVRDATSMEYVKDVAQQIEHVKLMPDFTNLVDPVINPKFSYLKDKACIVPNSKMIETGQQSSEEYVGLLSKCIQLLESQKIESFILIHEGIKDRDIAYEINKLLKEDVEIVSCENPLDVKGIIGESKFLIGSRFHSVVSALSQGIPAFCTSWSHKYQMLLNNYNFPEGLLNCDASEDQLRDAFKIIFNENEYLETKQKLLDLSFSQKKLVKGMWDEIFNGIKDK